jgi:alcohol dehydrogenase (cytochrome c)
MVASGALRACSRYHLPARPRVIALGAALLALSAIGCGGSKTSPDAITISRNPAPTVTIDWPSFGGDADQSRFSPLNEIDPTSITRLGVAWTYEPGPGNAQWESYPVVVGRTLFVTTNTGEVMARDAVTGALRWSYTPQVDFLIGSAVGGVQPMHRGVTVADGRVYLVTWDDQLIALRADSGRELWKVRIADPRTGVVERSPPTFWDGRLYVGSGGNDVTRVRGFVAAFDAATGRRLWRFATVAPGRGGGHVWMPPTVDAHTGLVYAGTGNPSPALTRARRSGCEDWVSGMVALDGRTGALRWGAHEVCGDVWDYDGGQPPLLFDARVGGRRVRAVGHANKSGTYWIRDAATGRPLAAPRAIVGQTRPRPRPTARGTKLCPGALGGVAYSPAALSPQTRLIYQPTVRLCMVYRTASRDPDAQAVLLGGGNARVAPGTKARGSLVALDADTNAVRWRRTLPAPAVGGALATAGGLVLTGCDDGFLYAFDARTGRRVWRGRIGLPFGTAPLSYRIGAVQYVAVVAGGSSVTALTGTRPGARLVVLKLGGRQLPSR